MNSELKNDPAALPRMACCASVRHNAACVSNSAENETQDLAQCPHCGSQDCGKDVEMLQILSTTK